MQGAEQRSLIDRAGATHLLGENPSQVTLPILYRTVHYQAGLGNNYAKAFGQRKNEKLQLFV